MASPTNCINFANGLSSVSVITEWLDRTSHRKQNRWRIEQPHFVHTDAPSVLFPVRRSVQPPSRAVVTAYPCPMSKNGKHIIHYVNWSYISINLYLLTNVALTEGLLWSETVNCSGPFDSTLAFINGTQYEPKVFFAFRFRSPVLNQRSILRAYFTARA